jgi:flagellar biosynthetic protein FlhB
VPVLQAPPLARALYAHTEVDQEIPAALFAAVAQVLAWVYQLRAAMAAGGPPTAAPERGGAARPGPRTTSRAARPDNDAEVDA